MELSLLIYLSDVHDRCPYVTHVFLVQHHMASFGDATSEAAKATEISGNGPDSVKRLLAEPAKISASLSKSAKFDEVLTKRLMLRHLSVGTKAEDTSKTEIQVTYSITVNTCRQDPF
jgi:hypothetical protein